MEPFVGEIRMMGFNFAPRGWAFCDGETLPINQNMALYALLGISFGGNGQVSFKLPDLRGRMPIHAGRGRTTTPRYVGDAGGSETVWLTTAQIPGHTHQAMASGDGAGTADPTGAVPAVAAADVYGPVQNLVPMAEAAVGTAGTGAAHENMPPFTVVNFCIALWGIFPPRS